MIWFTWRQFRLPALAGLGAARAPPTAASGGMNGCHAWLESQNLTQRTIYLGADKFWVLQWRELGVLLVASALLAALLLLVDPAPGDVASDGTLGNRLMLRYGI